MDYATLNPTLAALAAAYGRGPIAGPRLNPAQSRPLRPDEAERLRAQGNRFETAELWVSLDFRPDQVWNCRFEGPVGLGDGSGGLHDSRFRRCELGPGVRVEDRCLIEDCLIDRGAQLRASTVRCTEPTAFGVGTLLRPGLESGPRTLALQSEWALEDVTTALREGRFGPKAFPQALDFSYSFVGAGARLEACPSLDKAYIGPALRAHCAQVVDNFAGLSTGEQPIHLGPGVSVRNSVAQAGVHLDSAAQVESTLMLEASGAARRALVSLSVLGPNTEIGAGEVTACLVGPFVGFHHQSLLIAVTWPGGRGNVGSGAQIGSNHSSRAPDQGLLAPEGAFFGLSTSVKYPSNLSAAPYLTLATGVIAGPQRLETPFSLIVPGPGPSPLFPALNRLIPGWVLAENLYSVIRSEGKFLQRNRARQALGDLRVFRPEIVDNLWRASEQLGMLCGKPVYTSQDWEGIGSNYLQESDRLQGFETYQWFQCWAVAESWTDRWESGAGPEFPPDLWSGRLGLDLNDRRGLGRWWLAAAEQVLAQCRHARAKDAERGRRLDPDYDRDHEALDQDPFLQGLAQRLAEKARRVEARIR